MPGLPRYVPVATAKMFRMQMNSPHPLVFMTEENQEETIAVMSARRAVCAHKWEEITVPSVGSLPMLVQTVCEFCLIDKNEWDNVSALAQSSSDAPLERPL